MPAAASPPRANLWEWAQTIVLASNLAWTTLGLGGYLPETKLVSIGLTALALAIHFLGRSIAKSTPPSFHPAGWLLVPFLIYAAVNVRWITPVPWLGWMDWLGWAQMIATFWIVLNGVRSPLPRWTLFATLLLLGLIATTLACYQRFVQPDWLMLGRVQAGQFLGRASGSFGIPNSLAGFLLLLLPPSIALTARPAARPNERIFFGWLTAILLLGLGLTISRGAWVALALALPVWPLFARRWSLSRRIAIASATLGFLLLAGAVAGTAAPKVRERFARLVLDEGERTRPIMWRAAWEIFSAHPLVGSGAASYNVLFEQHRTERVQGEPQWAHQEYLNTLSDYGLVGFGLFFGAGGVIAWRCARRRRPEEIKAATEPRGWEPRRGSGNFPRPTRWDESLADPFVQHGFALGLLAFALQLALDFHFKIPALALAFATIAALAVGLNWPLPAADAPATHRATGMRRFAGGAAAALLAVAAAGWLPTHYRAEAIRYDLRRQLDTLAKPTTTPAEKQAVASRAHNEIGRVVQLSPANAQAWADRAYAAAIVARYAPESQVELGRAAEVDARRALALGQVVPEFWVRLGVALDMQQRWLEAGDAFSEALRLAPFSGRIWFHHAYHLALNPVAIPLARAAVATCLRLDPGNVEGESLQRNLSARP